MWTPYALAALVFVLDQLSKWWILEVVRLREIGFVDVLPVFRLTFVGNVGVSMGLFGAGSEVQRWALVAVTGGIALAVAIWAAREKNRWDGAALGLVLGGAVGNIVDRVRFGYVVDFLHVFWGEWSFWVFNIADGAITIGVLMLLLRALMPDKDKTHA
ncbi:MAG: signal peptidase II [Polymorphobacter sp.]|uniref:signal peptidase II n=1 Tax=Polymorphobacter sp. TaxID=1909290 RepID=UPI003A894A4C